MPTLSVRRLFPADRTALEQLFEHDAGFAQRVHGRASRPEDVEAVFRSRPPGCGPDQKNTLGLWHGDDLVGIADLITDFPAPGTNYLGLLQIHSGYHHRGFARFLHTTLLSLFPHAQRWRLGVVDTNRDALGLWKRLGYDETGETPQWTNPAGDSHEVIIMELALAPDDSPLPQPPRGHTS